MIYIGISLYDDEGKTIPIEKRYAAPVIVVWISRVTIIYFTVHTQKHSVFKKQYKYISSMPRYDPASAAIL